MNNTTIPENPFRPGVGQKPPYLAGREVEKDHFRELLNQKPVMKNLIVTGLRGIGKSALLEELKPIASTNGWLWAGTTLSESTSVSEETIAIRLLTDLSVYTSNLLSINRPATGFNAEQKSTPLDYQTLEAHFKGQPGLIADKLKSTLEYIWSGLQTIPAIKGVVFAYDEAQEMSDQEKRRQYPLSILLDVFQSLQSKGLPFMLVLAGLPTLYPKLCETRGYAERMFTVEELCNLPLEEAKKAITVPITNSPSTITFTDTSVDLIAETSGGYPYFIQFICKETFDSFIVQMRQNIDPSVPLKEIRAKIDTDFFSPRWNVVTERERQVLGVIAALPEGDGEFMIKEVVDKGKSLLKKPLGNVQVSHLLANLTKDGLVFKTNRHGKYKLGVPMLRDFVTRQNIFNMREI